MWVPICRSQVNACGSITNICRSLGDRLKCESRVAGRKMQVASCEMQVAIAKCQGIGEFFGISMAYLCNSFVLSDIDFIFGMVLV